MRRTYSRESGILYVDTAVTIHSHGTRRYRQTSYGQASAKEYFRRVSNVFMRGSAGVKQVH